MIGKQTYEVNLQSEIFKSFRTQLAANSLDIDVEKKSKHHLKVDCNFPKDWKIGVIYGASGSGKTTLAKQIFGEKIFDISIDENLPVIEQFSDSMNYEDCSKALSGIGLTSVPCWIRPIKTLSNGQKARAEASLLMHKENVPIIVIDEWTSVVDRTVAKIMSHCVSKQANRQTGKQIILLSCHYDIIEWVKPDWLIDCNVQQFILPQSETFFFQPREKLEFTIKRIDRTSWKYFSKYHYLSELLPGGSIYTFGLFHGENQIGFQCWANYVPDRKGHKRIYHSNRTVIHPDYAGFGMGIQLINETAKWMVENVECKLMAKFSSLPIHKLMIKQKCWKFIGEKMLFGKMKTGGNMDRKGGFRENGIKTYHYEYR